MSVMMQDLLNTYKFGWKTSYYQNTYDYKTDDDEPAHSLGWHDNVKEKPVERTEFNGTDEEYDDYCEACNI
jgi:ribonucleoside-diphosphate reductase alpha chain